MNCIYCGTPLSGIDYCTGCGADVTLQKTDHPDFKPSVQRRTGEGYGAGSVRSHCLPETEPEI